MILAGDAEPRVLQGSGFPVGVLEQAEYEDAEVRLRPGDRFWLYSDGLQEAMNPAGEQFGKGRLIRELHAASAEALSGAVRKVLRTVESWAGENGPQDDISLVAFEIDRLDLKGEDEIAIESRRIARANLKEAIYQHTKSKQNGKVIWLKAADG